MNLEHWLALLAILIAVGLVLWACWSGDQPRLWLQDDPPPTVQMFHPDAPTYYLSALNQPEATDALFDADPRSLAAVFGRRTHELIRQGADVGEVYRTARIAFGHAFRADPMLRQEPKPERLLVLPLRRDLHLVHRIH